MVAKLFLGLSALLFAAAPAAAANTPWGQCGGQGWSGDCPSGYVCTVSNQYYSQCIPGTASGTPTSAPTSTTGGAGSPTSTAAGGTATLLPGYSFIRAVVDPNFHKYLRSEKVGTASDAVLGDPSTAGQFKIVDGQLVQYLTATTQLYATVEGRADSTVKKLKVSWSTSPASGTNAGTFLWSGDTLEWQSTTISRPQINAWLVCPDDAGNRDLYVNLGSYSYQTPAGCADQTIHAYTGSTATA